MGRVQLAEGELNYRLDGPQGAPVLVLSNSLGTDLGMWDTQIPAFAEHFQVVRYDTRGHGQSLVTEGPYSIEQLGGDVLALLDALHIERAHFCGLSMGGLIGQWLGINAGNRLHKLVVCNTAAKIGEPSVWNPRIEMVLRDGAQAMAGLRDASIARWFTPDFAQANPGQAKRITDMLAATSPQGYAANCAAVRDAETAILEIRTIQFEQSISAMLIAVDGESWICTLQLAMISSAVAGDITRALVLQKAQSRASCVKRFP